MQARDGRTPDEQRGTSVDLQSLMTALGRQWVRAELAADIEALDALTTEDFTLVGPLGYVLSKSAWLDRYRHGDMSTESLRWEDVAIRSYGTCAIAVGRMTQRADYRGTPVDGSFRLTQVAVTAGPTVLLAGMHLSAVTAAAAARRP